MLAVRQRIGAAERSDAPECTQEGGEALSVRAGRDTLVRLGGGNASGIDTWARRSHCASRSANRGTRTATSRAVDRLEKWLVGCLSRFHSLKQLENRCHDIFFVTFG